MTHNHIYVEPPFWVASNEDEETVKQLCVELEGRLNHPDPSYDWADVVQRCQNHWEMACDITIERYPVTILSAAETLPVVPASSKVALKSLATSDEFLDVISVAALKRALSG